MTPSGPLGVWPSVVVLSTSWKLPQNFPGSENASAGLSSPTTQTPEAECRCRGTGRGGTGRGGTVRGGERGRRPQSRGPTEARNPRPAVRPPPSAAASPAPGRPGGARGKGRGGPGQPARPAQARCVATWPRLARGPPPARARRLQEKARPLERNHCSRHCREVSQREP